MDQKRTVEAQTEIPKIGYLSSLGNYSKLLKWEFENMSEIIIMIISTAFFISLLGGYFWNQNIKIKKNNHEIIRPRFSS